MALYLDTHPQLNQAGQPGLFLNLLSFIAAAGPLAFSLDMLMLMLSAFLRFGQGQHEGPPRIILVLCGLELTVPGMGETLGARLVLYWLSSAVIVVWCGMAYHWLDSSSSTQRPVAKEPACYIDSQKITNCS